MLMRGPAALQEHRLSAPALGNLSRLLQLLQVLGIPTLRGDSGGPVGGVCFIIPRRRGWFALAQPQALVPGRTVAVKVAWAQK
eukprot:10833416-Lingulodinium_polyedra.AAC.1